MSMKDEDGIGMVSEPAAARPKKAGRKALDTGKPVPEEVPMDTGASLSAADSEAASAGHEGAATKEDVSREEVPPSPDAAEPVASDEEAAAGQQTSVPARSGDDAPTDAESGLPLSATETDPVATEEVSTGSVDAETGTDAPVSIGGPKGAGVSTEEAVPESAVSQQQSVPPQEAASSKPGTRDEPVDARSVSAPAIAVPAAGIAAAVAAAKSGEVMAAPEVTHAQKNDAAKAGDVPIIVPDVRPDAAVTESAGAQSGDDAKAGAPPIVNGPAARPAPPSRGSGTGIWAAAAAIAIVAGLGWYAHANGWVYGGDGAERTATTSDEPGSSAVAKAANAQAGTDSADRATPVSAANGDEEIRALRERLQEAEKRLAAYEKSEQARAGVKPAPGRDPAASATQPDGNAQAREAETADRAETGRGMRDVTPIRRGDDEEETAGAAAPEPAETDAAGADVPDSAMAAPAIPPALPTPRPTTFARAEPRLPRPENISVPRLREPENPVLRGWYLRQVYDGAALIDGPYGPVEVVPGDTLPGTGRIQSIRRVGGGWAVMTSRGIIPYRP